MNIAGREIGPGHPCYVVAELSGNHAGSLERALRLIEEARQADADAAKIQCFDPSRMALPGVKCPGGPWEGQDLVDLYRRVVTPREWIPLLFQYAKKVGITLFASVFDPEDVDFLEAKVDCPAYKIASSEAMHADLIARVQQTGKPVMVSGGAFDMLGIVRQWLILHRSNVVFMHCVPSYPAATDQMNLCAITRYRTEVRNVGFSDHSEGTLAAEVAVALGACVVEKHLMLDSAWYREGRGPCDEEFSLTSGPFSSMVADIRGAETMLKLCTSNGSVYSRSWWVVRDIRKGEPITREALRYVRPASGVQTLTVAHQAALPAPTRTLIRHGRRRRT